jgi:hypothetical protein
MDMALPTPARAVGGTESGIFRDVVMIEQQVSRQNVFGG